MLPIGGVDEEFTHSGFGENSLDFRSLDREAPAVVLGLELTRARREVQGVLVDRDLHDGAGTASASRLEEERGDVGRTGHENEKGALAMTCSKFCSRSQVQYCGNSPEASVIICRSLQRSECAFE